VIIIGSFSYKESSMTALRQRMIEDLRLRNLSPHTIEAYVGAVARFAQHFGRSPDQLDAAAAREYLLHLVKDRQVGWSRYNIAVHTTARERRQPLPAHNRQIPPSRHLRLINTSRIHRPSTPDRATAPGKSPRTFSRQHGIHLIQFP
jgi:hypothetical protein